MRRFDEGVDVVALDRSSQVFIAFDRTNKNTVVFLFFLWPQKDFYSRFWIHHFIYKLLSSLDLLGLREAGLETLAARAQYINFNLHMFRFFVDFSLVWGEVFGGCCTKEQQQWWADPSRSSWSDSCPCPSPEMFGVRQKRCGVGPGIYFY